MLVHVGILKTWSRNCTVQAAAFTMETLHAFHPWRWAPRTCLSADSSATTAKVHGEDPTVMSGVLMAHEQASNWPAAPSGQASHVSTRPEALAGWLPSQNTTPKQYQYQRERAKRERERGRKGMRQARSRDVPLQPQQIDVKHLQVSAMDPPLQV